MGCAEHLRRGLADEKARLIEIKVLRAYLNGLMQEIDDLQREKSSLKAAKFAKEAYQELFDVEKRLEMLEAEFPNAFKEV